MNNFCKFEGIKHDINMKISQIISAIISAGAIFDTVWGVLAENQGLLIEIGIPTTVTKVIMLVGLIYTAFSKSLKPVIFADEPIEGGGIKNPK